jgi:hypothetical protein
MLTSQRPALNLVLMMVFLAERKWQAKGMGHETGQYVTM